MIPTTPRWPRPCGRRGGKERTGLPDGDVIEIDEDGIVKKIPDERDALRAEVARLLAMQHEIQDIIDNSFLREAGRFRQIEEIVTHATLAPPTEAT